MIYVNNEYAIGFKHTSQDSVRATKCFIYQVDNNRLGAVVGTGVAYCHYKDQFNKEKGRKLALRRAVQEAFPRGPERVSVWDAYFNR